MRYSINILLGMLAFLGSHQQAIAGGWVWEAQITNLHIIDDEVNITLVSTRTNNERPEDFYNTGTPETFFGCDTVKINSKYNLIEIPFYQNGHSKNNHFNAIKILEDHYLNKKNITIFYEAPMAKKQKECEFWSNAIDIESNDAIRLYYSE